MSNDPERRKRVDEILAAMGELASDLELQAVIDEDQGFTGRRLSHTLEMVFQERWEVRVIRQNLLSRVVKLENEVKRLLERLEGE